jgi:hypothetical protein
MCSTKIHFKREILEKIYLTFIRPLLEYSCEVRDNCPGVYESQQKVCWFAQI